MSYIDSTAIFGDNVLIEEDVYIGPYCIIGYPAEWKGKESENAGVIIRKGTRITGHVTIDTGAVTPTEIGENCYLMKHSYIAHDCKIGNNVTISAGVKLAGLVKVGDNTNIGMNAVIHQKQTIAEGCMIGMGSVITKKLVTEPFLKYAGNPAKAIGLNIPR